MSNHSPRPNQGLPSWRRPYALPQLPPFEAPTPPTVARPHRAGHLGRLLTVVGLWYLACGAVLALVIAVAEAQTAVAAQLGTDLAQWATVVERSATGFVAHLGAVLVPAGAMLVIGFTLHRGTP